MSKNLRGVAQPVAEFRGIVRVILAGACEAEVEHSGRFLGVGDAVGELPLNRGFLKIRADLVENERHVGAGHGNLDNSGRRREIKERQPPSLANDLSPAVLHHISRRRHLKETKSKHVTALHESAKSLLPFVTCNAGNRAVPAGPRPGIAAPGCDGTSRKCTCSCRAKSVWATITPESEPAERALGLDARTPGHRCECDQRTVAAMLRA